MRKDATILWREPIGEKDTIWWSDKLSDAEMRELSWITDIRDITELELYISGKSRLLSSWGTKDLPGLSVQWADSSLHSEWQKPRNTPSWRSIVHEIRMIKTPEETEKIRNCIRITESIYEEIIEKIHPWMCEYEIEAMIAYGFRRHHGTEAFPTIVASGANSCTLHYTANTRKIETGDIVLLDFGIELDGYGADLSRTFAVGGFSPRQQRIYDAVLEVRDFAERELVPGITRRAWAIRVKEYMYEVCKRLELENIANYIATTNPYFPHSIGHFLGLDTHDVGDSDMPLAPGMILTIEPGIYIRDEAIWIRVEDDYLVTETGCERLR
jgi:Xaa-Pro aminopeptidase